VKCFYDERQAVGVCKHCGRGICEESSSTVGKGLACQGRCEDEVKTLNELLTRQSKIYRRTAAVYWRYALVAGLFGLFSLGFGLLEQDYLDRMAVFFQIAGAIMLLGSGLGVYNGLKVRQT
jgi:hypothetical protein